MVYMKKPERLLKEILIIYRLLTNITDLWLPQQKEVKLLNVPWDSYKK